MLFQDYIRKFQAALEDEIKELKDNGSQKTHISDGIYLSGTQGKRLYSFTAETEVRFPDDTEVILEWQGKRYEGVLVSVEGCDIILSIERKLGDSIANAILLTEPWFLLKKLKQRLDWAERSTNANRKLAEALLSNTLHEFTLPPLPSVEDLMGASQSCRNSTLFLS